MDKVMMKKEKKVTAKKNIVKGMNHRVNWILMNLSQR